MIGVALSLALILLLGAVEAWLSRRASSGIPLRIQVNGIRGKSTVTRLIYGALRANGIRVMAKTTGTEARVLLPDGSERPVLRRGLPNIRETLWFLRAARKQGATAVVVECMAVRPELQWTVEHRMLRSTHGVITNVRSDHLETMGRTLPEIAASLSNTIPGGGVVVTGDAAYAAFFQERARRLGTTVLLAGDDDPRASEPEWLREDEAIALTLVRSLGLDEDLARRGMREARPDPGTVTTTRVAFGGVQTKFVNAMAANDPESFRLLCRDYLAGRKPAVVIYNHRWDRPERLRLFLTEIASLGSDEVVVTGDPAPWTLGRSCGRNHRWRYVPGRRVARHLAETLKARARLSATAAPAGLDSAAELPTILACGNIKGSAWFESSLSLSPGEAVATGA